MTTETATAPAARTETAGINPVAALAHLATVIDALDGFLDRPPLQVQYATLVPLIRRVVYARNTLAVGFDLWQTDLARRLLKSKGGFYIYSMTAEESAGFTRRIAPSLTFTAGELTALVAEFPVFAGLAHLAPGVEKLAQDSRLYAAENKICLCRAIESGVDFAPAPIASRSLPIERV